MIKVSLYVIFHTVSHPGGGSFISFESRLHGFVVVHHSFQNDDLFRGALFF